jgi:hypothetical protein
MYPPLGIDELAFSQELITLFGQPVPGYEIKPFRLLAAFPFRRSINPVGSYRKRSYRFSVGRKTHFRFITDIPDYRYFVQTRHCLFTSPVQLVSL